MPPEIVGQGPGGEPIVAGSWVFRMHDTHGYPLDLTLLDLKERGWGFDVCGYVEAARAAGWSDAKIRAHLTESHQMPPEAERLLDELLSLPRAILDNYLARKRALVCEAPRPPAGDAQGTTSHPFSPDPADSRAHPVR